MEKEIIYKTDVENIIKDWFPEDNDFFENDDPYYKSGVSLASHGIFDEIHKLKPINNCGFWVKAPSAETFVCNNCNADMPITGFNNFCGKCGSKNILITEAEKNNNIINITEWRNK